MSLLPRNGSSWSAAILAVRNFRRSFRERVEYFDRVFVLQFGSQRCNPPAELVFFRLGSLPCSLWHHSLMSDPIALRYRKMSFWVRVIRRFKVVFSAR